MFVSESYLFYASEGRNQQHQHHTCCMSMKIMSSHQTLNMNREGFHDIEINMNAYESIRNYEYDSIQFYSSL